jgi:hypothetical protein
MNYNEVNVKKANALNKRIKINLHYNETPHDAFEVIQTGEIRKTIPLFYFDEIIVNDDCRQIDNKIILSTDNLSVSETFYKSSDTITDFKIKYDLQKINNELFFKAHFIDQNYNKISNKNVKIIFESNNNEIETKTLRTTNDGNIIYHFPVILENMRLKIIIDDIEMMVNI